MLKVILARLQQGHRTIKCPGGFPPKLSDRVKGRPIIDAEKCNGSCRQCINACPTGAIEFTDSGLRIDMGKCLFCGECEKNCENKAVTFTDEARLAVRNRRDLIVTPGQGWQRPAAVMCAELKKLLGRSLKLRQVSTGGCNACEADTNVLNTLAWDLGRFGIQFVASPRHADGLLITGPVTQNMKLALKKTYDAVPEPKIVIAVGACAISGGPYVGHEEANDGADNVIPVDLYIPGCPPHPYTILEGIVAFLGKNCCSQDCGNSRYNSMRTNQMINHNLSKGIDVYKVQSLLLLELIFKCDSVMRHIEKKPKVRIIMLGNVPFIDTTGLQHLIDFCKMCKNGIWRLFFQKYLLKFLMPLTRAN